MKLQEKWKNLMHRWFDGDLTMPKVYLWMAGLICLLAGILYGLLAAPVTHGLMIGCNNGNSVTTDRDNRHGTKQEEGEAEETQRC